MAQILPFKGLRYNEAKVGELSKVMTPPYDIISPAEQEEYYRMSDYNIIRLELGKEEPEDNEHNNKYTRAAMYLSDWIEQQVIIREPEPSLYVYQQLFKLSDGTEYTRTGFIGLVRLEEFSKGVILPHENTLSKPKADRLQLMRACSANFSQIFGLYDDPEKTVPMLLCQYISENSPVLQVEAIEGIIEKLWVISDQEIIARIQESMLEKKLYIADGHHRYETALTYRNELIQKNPDHTGNELYNFVMMMMVEMEDPGLIILPTHRIICGIENMETQGVLEKAAVSFSIKEYKFSAGGQKERAIEIDAALKQSAPHSFIYYDGNRSTYYLLTLKDLNQMKERLPQHDESYRTLDVSILHTLLIGPVLGIGKEQLANQEFIKYTHDIEEGMLLVEDGDCQMALFMNPTSIKQVKEISLAGEKMPQKSTYFYPKLLTGLVFNKID